MPTYPYEIDYYVTEQGDKPFKNWLEGLRDVQGRARIRVRLDRVPTVGNLGDHRSVGAGVQELRIDYAPVSGLLWYRRQARGPAAAGRRKSSQPGISSKPKNSGGISKGDRQWLKPRLSTRFDRRAQRPRRGGGLPQCGDRRGGSGRFSARFAQCRRSRGGMTALAEKAQLSRESLYRTLSNRGNPEIKSLRAILHAMGLKLAVEPETRETPAA